MSITRRRTANLTALLAGIAALVLVLAPNATGDSDWPPAPSAAGAVHLTG